MKYNAEYIRNRVGGSYEKAVKVYALVAMFYDNPTKAPSKTWERAIRTISKDPCDNCQYIEGSNCSHPKVSTEGVNGCPFTLPYLPY